MRNPARTLSETRASARCTLVLACLALAGFEAPQLAAQTALPGLALAPRLVEALPNAPGFQTGPVRGNIFLSAGLLGDDNLNLSETDPAQDLIHLVQPGLALAAGSRLRFNAAYAPTFRFYQDNPDLDYVQHDAAAEVGYSFGRNRVTLNASYQRTAEPDDTVRRILLRDEFRMEGTFSLALSPKTEFETAPRSRWLLPDSGADSQTIALRQSVYYRFSPKLRVGLGAELGREQVDGSPDQTYIQELARAVWLLSPKLQVDLTVGLEQRHIDDPDQPATVVLPLLDAQTQWLPLPGTLVKFGIGFRQSASLDVPGEVEVQSSARFEWRQRFLRFHQATLGASYSHFEFQDAGELSGDEDQFSVQAGLEFRLARHWTVSTAYRWTETQSSRPGDSYRRNQLEVRGAYRY